MSYGSSSLGSGSRTSRATFEYGRTHVVKPKGRHQATIIWLHGLGDNGSSWSQLLETLPLPNIKWICPTAPTRPVAVFGGFPCTAWFDVGDLSEDGPDDVEGLDASSAHVANLLSTEPADIKLGVGGFSMGAATALYSATCCANGKYGNGNPYPVNLSAVVGLSGWLPCSRGLKNKIEGSQEAARRAASLPLLLCHGKGQGTFGCTANVQSMGKFDPTVRFVIFGDMINKTCIIKQASVFPLYLPQIRMIHDMYGDDVVLYKHGEKSANVLTSTGFQNLGFKTYGGLGHYTVPEEMDDVCKWLTARLGLDGSSS